MRILFQLALRNILRSPRRSLIILVLQGAIITLFFLGNSLLLQSNNGMKKGFIDNFTGDAMIKAPTDLPVSVFGAITPSIEDFFTIPEIPNHDSEKSELLVSDYLESAVSLISGRAIFRYKGYSSPIPIFGIDGDEYFGFFPGLKIIQGESINTGEIGLLITKSRADKIASQLGEPPLIGHPVLLSSYANGNFRIRELPLAGIIEYENPISVLDEVVLIDAQTLRELNQVTLAVDSDFIPEEEAVSLMDDSLDSLFSSDIPVIEDEAKHSESLTLDLLKSVMREENPNEGKMLTGGGWHFILLRFKEGIRPKAALSDLNTILEPRDLEAVGWRDAAGLSAFLILLLRVLFNGGFILVVTAGVIAVVNILVISIIERTGEIGTLRAIGSSRSFVRRLLVTENVLLALVSGILAVGSAVLILTVLNNAHLRLSNSLLSSLFGSSVFLVHISFSVVLWSLLLALFLGIVASWFPTIMALRVQPARAAAQE